MGLCYKSESNFYFLPTQSLLQRWLREIHKINVESNYLPNVGKYKSTFKPMTIIPKTFRNFKECYIKCSKYYGNIYHNTYEESLEEALLEALKLIKL